MSSALDFLLDGWKVLLLLISIHFEALSGQYSQSKSYLIRCWYLVVFFFRKLSTVIDFILASALFGQMLRSFDMLWWILQFSLSLFKFSTKNSWPFSIEGFPRAWDYSSKSDPSLDSVRWIQIKNLKSSFEIRLYIFCLFLLNIMMSLISLTDPSVLLSGWCMKMEWILEYTF